MITSQQLKEAGYYASDLLVAQLNAVLLTRPTSGAFLYGPAGSGKTFLAETVSSVIGAKQFFYQVTPGTREDDLIEKLLPDENTNSGIKKYPGVLLQAAEASHSEKVVLIVDEWDKTRPSADAFLLDFLQSGRINWPGVSVQANLANLTVFLTLNDERELSEPLTRRLPLIRCEAPSIGVVQEALASYKENPIVGKALEIYSKSLKADLSRPVTIQELKQFMDSHTIDMDLEARMKLFIFKDEESFNVISGVKVDTSHNDESISSSYEEDIDYQRWLVWQILCPLPTLRIFALSSH